MRMKAETRVWYSAWPSARMPHSERGYHGTLKSRSHHVRRTHRGELCDCRHGGDGVGAQASTTVSVPGRLGPDIPIRNRKVEQDPVSNGPVRHRQANMVKEVNAVLGSQGAPCPVGPPAVM